MMPEATSQNHGSSSLAGSRLRTVTILETNSFVERQFSLTSCNQGDRSFLSRVAATGDNDGLTNIILEGPNQSGRSSLSMEMCVEHALKARCLCGSALQHCKCMPVAFLRPSSVADSFPVLCRCHGRKQERDLEVLESNYELTSPRNIDGVSFNWNKSLLQRIQIHHCASFRDLLQFLLSLQGKHLNEQPYEAIIIDDIDRFSDDCLGAKQSSMQVAQLLAILFDTVNFLKRRPSLCVTMNIKSQYPKDCFMTSFFSSIVTIHETSIDPNTWNCHEYSPEVQSSWTVWVRQVGSTRNEPRKQLDYIIAHNGSDGYEILWREICN